MRVNLLIVVQTLLLLFGVTSELVAHDLWLVPAKFSNSTGTKVEIGLAVGMDFPKSLNTVSKDRVTLVATNGNDTIREFTLAVNEENKMTSAIFAPTKAGVWVVGCETKTNRIELEAKKFNDYLLHDGLPHILAERLDRDELDKPAKEQYSKYTKTIFQVGKDLDATQIKQAMRPLGHRLEIIPLEDITSKKAGEILQVQVLFEQKPLADSNVCWDRAGNGEKFTGQTWTDSEGKCFVPLAHSGPMTVRLVHMTHPQTPEYEWESFWSSLTINVSDESGK